ncbi:MAG TPA: MGMT family protein [Candidatus Saccharimonadales bacterium]|nr:MGMT family protein [Candidatus Saccharimonadales bacterium]
MKRADNAFRDRVYAVVALIPKGKVTNYGTVALLAGSPYSARLVGGVAHWGDPALPWQRVVMKDGGLATGYPGGTTGHRTALEAEGVEFTPDGKVNLSKHFWVPKGVDIS